MNPCRGRHRSDNSQEISSSTAPSGQRRGSTLNGLNPYRRIARADASFERR
jgi:hypothetical protein